VIRKVSQNFLEFLWDYLRDLARDQIGEKYYRDWLPFIGTLFLFIFVSNWGGALIPWKVIELPKENLGAPTADINTTVAMALLGDTGLFLRRFEQEGLEILRALRGANPDHAPVQDHRGIYEAPLSFFPSFRKHPC